MLFINYLRVYRGLAVSLSGLILITLVCYNKTYRDMNREIELLREEMIVYENREMLLREDLVQLEQEHNYLKHENESLIQELEVVNREVIYSPNNLTITSGATTYHYREMFRNTGLEGYENLFVEIEEMGINGIFVASLCINESGWNLDSKRARNDNNVTGMGGYTSSSEGMSYQTKEECIRDTVNMLLKNYLNKEGTYYKGVSIYNVNESYCLGEDGKTYIKWSNDINSIANSLIKKVNK